MLSAFTGNKKTVAGVLSVFTKAVADLEAVERNNLAEVESHKVAIAQAQASQAAATQEANDARSVIEKMLAIVTPSATGAYYSAGEANVPPFKLTLAGTA